MSHEQNLLSKASISNTRFLQTCVSTVSAKSVATDNRMASPRHTTFHAPSLLSLVLRFPVSAVSTVSSCHLSYRTSPLYSYIDGMYIHFSPPHHILIPNAVRPMPIRKRGPNSSHVGASFPTNTLRNSVSHVVAGTQTDSHEHEHGVPTAGLAPTDHL